MFQNLLRSIVHFSPIRLKAGCLIGLFCVPFLAGCATHPILDDVSNPLKTEDVVKFARCEMRSTIIELVRKLSIAPDATEDQIIAVTKSIKAKARALAKINDARAPRPPIPLDERLSKNELAIKRYMDVAVAYDMNFNITEHNNADGSLGFKLPFTAPAALDVGASGAVHLTRQGQRQFKATETWGKLVANSECRRIGGRYENFGYPIAGSMGLEKLAGTFIAISDQGGAKDSFVETLTFTTQVGAALSAGLKLNAVPESFRVVSASATLEGGRIDVHKMIVSLVFPHEEGTSAISGVDRYDGDMNAPFDRPAPWRARYNICVADARSREDDFKTLREHPPEVYCITYADAFAPAAGETITTRPKVARSKYFTPSTKGAGGRTMSAPEQTTRAPDRNLRTKQVPIRPNFF